MESSNLKGKKVVVGLSGGVDSSVCAAILKEQGAEVIGLFMKNWEETDERGDCIASKEYEDVIKVCEKLDIPYYSVDFVEEYRKNVFNDFLEGYKKGITPNPDILCNREIKFKVFFDQAMALGADFLATGHYCQVQKDGDRHSLLKGADDNKDQSYFLAAINDEVLDRVLFPIGGLLKPEVREIAQKYDLSTAQKKDSTGICFIGERKFRPFLSQFLTPKKGNFVDLESGEVVGEHTGSHFYTIGQRKGLGLGGEGEPWFVTSKCTESNIVYVARGTEHPSLFVNSCTVMEFNQINSDILCASGEVECFAKLRYRQKEVPCVAKVVDGEIELTFKHSQRAVTIGQTAVLYHGQKCLGGGFIKSTGPTCFDKGIPPVLP